MRYILIRRKTVLLDQETGLRWRMPPEVADLFDKKKVAVFKSPKSWRDPIPLTRSVKQGIIATRSTYEKMRAVRKWTKR